VKAEGWHRIEVKVLAAAGRQRSATTSQSASTNRDGHVDPAGPHGPAAAASFDRARQRGRRDLRHPAPVRARRRLAATYAQARRLSADLPRQGRAAGLTLTSATRKTTPG
jgi:hypothetical protein